VLPAAPLAHIGHWYHALLYLAPVFILVIVFAVQGRRERLAEEREEPPRPGPHIAECPRCGAAIRASGDVRDEA